MNTAPIVSTRIPGAFVDRGPLEMQPWMTGERERVEDQIYSMFCPKCGAPNAEDAKYCRACGTDVGNVFAIIEGRAPEHKAIDEKQIALFSSGLRGLMIGIGLLIVSGLSLAISMRLAVLSIFALAFGFVFLGTGIARLVQARSLKALRAPKTQPTTRALTQGET